MDEIIDDSPEIHSSAVESISPPLVGNEKPIARTKTNGAVTRKNAEPRTAQVKSRRMLNALKRGLFSRAALLLDGSKAEFASLLEGTMARLVARLWREYDRIMARIGLRRWVENISTNFATGPVFPGIQRSLLLCSPKSGYVRDCWLGRCAAMASLLDGL